MAQTKSVVTPKVIVNLLVVLVLLPLIPMIISGDWGWLEAWTYALLMILSFIISRILVARRHPDLIVERARYMEAQDTKPWDKLLAPLLALGSVVILAVAGLDRAYGWSSGFAIAWKWLSLGMILLGYGFSTWAMVENRFFAGTVRIQTERGHQVVTSGPYRWMRHPGYAGALLGYMFMPLLFDSAWAFIPAVLLLGVVVLRTALEDRTLQQELPGYREYAQHTRWRLLPGIW